MSVGMSSEVPSVVRNSCVSAVWFADRSGASSAPPRLGFRAFAASFVAPDYPPSTRSFG